MCDSKHHEHWCSACGKDLNKEPKDSYIEIEWSQNEKGQIIGDKKMICNSCLEGMENVKELDKYFKGLQYQPWGHVFCSVCKKDITEEHLKKLGIKEKILSKIRFDELPRAGIDYQCFGFKEHKEKKHFIKVVVLCKDCEKKEFNYENIEKLKKLGRNPTFKPEVRCPNTENCKQYKMGDKNVSCEHIVIGRDRKTLNMGLLCGRRHEGALLLPFDDGFQIIKPRKGKGAAVSNPVNVAIPSGQNLMQDYVKVIEDMLKKYKLGKFGEPGPDYSLTLKLLENRIANIEKHLNISPPILESSVVPVKVFEAVSVVPVKKRNLKLVKSLIR